MNNDNPEVDKLKQRVADLTAICRRFKAERDEYAEKLSAIGKLTYPFGHKDPCGDNCTL